MPTVPDSFVPSVGQTANSGPPVSAGIVTPMQNRNPEQIQQFGQDLQQAGGLEFRTGQTIGDRVQDQVNDANTKAAETSFLQSSQSILNDPNNGYFRQLGKAAVDQYQPTQEALVKASNDAQAGLTNSLQKQMFKQVVQQHMLSFGKQMADYNHGQSVAYSAGESKARADSYQLLSLGAAGSRYQTDENGAPTGDFSKYTKQMEQEVLNTASLAGFGPDSAQAKAMLREQYTTLNQGIISNLLDNHDAAGAKQWFDEQNAAGNVDIRDVTRLGNAVKGEYDRQQTIDLADKAISGSLSSGKPPVTLAMPVPGSSINVTAGLGDPRAGGRSHDGIDIAVPVGTNVMAPAAGKVTKVWTDDKFGGGLSVEMELPNGMTAGFAHLSAANVRVGDDIQQGVQLGLSGKSGNATGPTLHYMMKDADGKYVDPRQVSQPQPDKGGISDPDALVKARQFIMDSDAAPEIKKAAIAQVETAHAQYRAIDNQRQVDTFKQASDAFYSGGSKVQSIPPSLFSQITPEQQQKLKDEETSKVLRDYSQGQQFKEMSEVDIRSQFMQNPDQLTPANVDAVRPRVANSTYLSLMNQAEQQAKNPKGVQEAQAVNERIKYFAGHAGVNMQPKTPADKQTLTDLTFRVQQDIDQLKTQNNGKATPDQVDKAIQQELIRRTTTKRSAWFDWTGFGNPNTTTTAPLGAVKTAIGSDGKSHYLDRNDQDMGVAE